MYATGMAQKKKKKKKERKKKCLVIDEFNSLCEVNWLSLDPH